MAGLQLAAGRPVGVRPATSRAPCSITASLRVKQPLCCSDLPSGLYRAQTPQTRHSVQVSAAAASFTVPIRPVKNILQTVITTRVTEEGLLAHFQQHGHAAGITGLVCLRHKWGEAPPSALVQYADPAQAAAAQKALHKTQIANCELDLHWGHPRSFMFTGLMPRNALYVRNVPAHHSKDDIEESFKRFGEVEEVKPIDHGDSCGSPAMLVYMASQQGADAAVASLKLRQGGPYLVRYKHPSPETRNGLMAALGLGGTDEDDVVGSLDDYE